MEEQIIHYLQGKASDADKLALLDWLQADEANKHAFAAVRDRWVRSGETPVDTSDAVDRAYRRFVNRMRREAACRKQPRLIVWMRLAAAVALLLLCAVGGYYIGREAAPEPAVAVAPPVMNRVLMGADGKGSVTLPDGTVVWLNANSMLTYPEWFDASVRQVRLEGEGYFEVMRDEQAPFLVEAEGMTVRVLGTHFVMKSYPGRATAEAALLSGSIEVLLPGKAQPIPLVPDQQIACSRADGTYRLTTVDAEECIVWTRDKLVCTNLPLADVLQRMRRWYDMEIKCRPGVPLADRLSLTIRKESPEEILALLSQITPIQYRIQGKQAVIYPLKGRDEE